MNSGGFWLKFGLFTVGLGQSFVFVLVPPLARDLGLSEVQTSIIFAISAVAWAMTSAGWGRASDRYGRRAPHCLYAQRNEGPVGRFQKCRKTRRIN